MSNITIGAIIPLYNGALFIREALESVLAQTVPPDEIIVIDDGSSDNGPQIVRELAEYHPIKLIMRDNGGIGAARNQAISASSSSHIALLDQDDIWYPDHLAILKRPFQRSRRPGLVYGNLDQIDKSGRMILRKCLNGGNSNPKTSLFNCLSQDMFILPGASLFSREAFELAGRFDERLSGYEDDDLFLRMFMTGTVMLFLHDTAVTKWRIYSGSTSFSPRMSTSRMIYFRKLVGLFPNDPDMRLNWTRDLIAPRFWRLVRGQLIDCMRKRNRDGADRSWRDLLEIAPYMHKRVRRRLALTRLAIDIFRRTPFHGVTRGLLSYVGK